MSIKSLLMCAVLAVAAGAPTLAHADDTPIKIGSLASLTGLTSTFGQSSDAGVRLAADEQNAHGGLLGRKIEIDSADTESSAEKTPDATLKLINQDGVCAIIGEVASSRTIAAASACNRAHVPLLSPASTNPRVTQLPYVFRACFIDDFQGVVIAKYVANDLKLMHAAMFTDIKNDYSTGLTKVFADEFPKLGGTIVASASYQAGDNNFKTQLTNLKAANPDVIFLPGYYTEATMIINQARELGITCPFIGGDGWDSDVLLKDGGKAINGCYFTNHYFAGDPDPKVQEFVKKYKAAHNNATPDAEAVLGYDAANLLFAAITKAGSTDGPAIRTALAETKDFPGVTGNITIDKKRNAVKPAVVLEVEDGKLLMVKRVAP
jgi:branched-chain amino acid transport system substrate-binding protein